MERATINIYEIVSQMQAKKEQYRIEPPYATFIEVKAELGGIDDGELYALLDAEMMNGTIVRHRHINGYSYSISEE